MGPDPLPDLNVCRSCKTGSCCFEGAELTKQEILRIIKTDPNVSKPWFRLVEPHEEPNAQFPFSTTIRDGTCVFQDQKNRCVIYKVRPSTCREFPLEKGKAARYYKRLCFLFEKDWPPNSPLKRTLKKRKKVAFC